MNQKEYDILAELFAKRRADMDNAQRQSEVPQAWDVAIIVVRGLQDDLADILEKTYKSFDRAKFETKCALLPVKEENKVKEETLKDIMG